MREVSPQTLLTWTKTERVHHCIALVAGRISSMYCSRKEQRTLYTVFRSTCPKIIENGFLYSARKVILKQHHGTTIFNERRNCCTFHLEASV